MKRAIITFFTVALALTIIACAAHEVKLKEQGLQPMTQAELEQLFSKPVEFSFSTPETSGDLKYADGKSEGTWRQGSGKGTYEIKDGLFCSRWDFRNMSERCFRVYKISDTEYHYVHPKTGSLESIDKLK